MLECNAHGVAGDWRLPSLDEELQCSNTLVGMATKAETRMYKRTSSVDSAYILRRVEDDKVARLAEMERDAKTRRGKGKDEDESSSHGGSEMQAIEGAAEEELAGDNHGHLWDQRAPCWFARGRCIAQRADERGAAQ